MSVGAIASAYSHASLNVPFPLAILLGGLVSSLVGAIVALLCSRLAGFLFAIATLGIGELLRVIAINIEALGGALGYKNVEFISINRYVVFLLVVFALLVSCLVLFERTLTRKAFTLLRENEILAASLGISRSRHVLVSITMGAFIAGVAGSFYIHNVGILDPRLFGFENSLLIIAFVIFGGTRSFLGPLIGASLLTVIPEMLRFSSNYRMILYGVAILVVIILRPEGILGTRKTQTRHNRLHATGNS